MAIKNKDKKLDIEVLKRLYGFVKPYQNRFYLLVFTIVLSAVFTPLLPLLIQYSIDGPVASGSYTGLSIALGLMFILLIINSILSFFNTFLAGWISQRIIHDIRKRVFEQIIKLKLKFYDETPIGKLVTRTISDVESLSEVFSSGFAAILGDLLQLVFILGLMFWLNWKLSLVAISTIPLLLISTYIFKEKVKKSFDMVRNAVANLNAFVQEHLSGMRLIQMFNVEKQEYEKFKKLNQEHKVANIKSILYYSIYFPVADVISALGVGLIVWYGSHGIIADEVSFGTITAFIMYINQFFRPIRMIADRINTLQMGVVSVSRIIEILDEEHYLENDGKLDTIILGDLTFKDVWFAYNQTNYVLKNINFSVEKGQSVAFVGATGAGKTSIINLINRFYDLNKGQILIDGLDINLLSLSSLRRQVGVVLQDVFLFSGSIENNLKLGDDSISRAQIIEASKLVGVHDFIMDLPGNYDFNVMERGGTLSMGQRQLISFVRAILHQPKIIILDEATSSVDSETEILIQNAIEKLMQGRTSIIIAHRLSTIQKADKIIVLDKGEIVEMGNHQILLQKKGFYTQLYALQFQDK
jgi:ATP-binding cassette, subfamily B, multidrug efflux pump